MALNVEQFSLYAAAILEKLFVSFPIPIEIKPDEYVERFDYLKLMEDLKKKVDEIPHDPTSFARAEQAARNMDKVSEAVSRNEHNKKVFSRALKN